MITTKQDPNDFILSALPPPDGLKQNTKVGPVPEDIKRIIAVEG
jgi:hypothetical protein